MLQYPRVSGNLADGDFSTSGRVNSCEVLPEVWLSTLGQTSKPSFNSVEESDVFKINNGDDVQADVCLIIDVNDNH